MPGLSGASARATACSWDARAAAAPIWARPHLGGWQTPQAAPRATGMRPQRASKEAAPGASQAAQPEQQHRPATRRRAWHAARQDRPSSHVSQAPQSQTARVAHSPDSPEPGAGQAPSAPRAIQADPDTPLLPDAHHLTNIVRQLAVAKQRPSARWWQAYYQACQTALDSASSPAAQGQSGSGTAHSAAQVSITLWCLATLSVRPPQTLVHELLRRLEQCWDGASQQSLAISLWSLGKLRVTPPQDFLIQWCQRFTATTVNQLTGDAHLAGAQQQLHVSQALWALATLQAKPKRAWLTDLLARTAPSLSHASPQSLSVTMWALGELKHTPNTAWSTVFFSVTQQHTARFTAQSVCNILQGLVSADVVPPGEWLEGLLTHAARGVRRWEYSAGQLASLVWLASELGCGGHLQLVLAAVQASARHMQWYSGAKPDATDTPGPTTPHTSTLPTQRQSHSQQQQQQLGAQSSGTYGGGNVQQAELARQTYTAEPAATQARPTTVRSYTRLRFVLPRHLGQGLMFRGRGQGTSTARGRVRVHAAAEPAGVASASAATSIEELADPRGGLPSSLRLKLVRYLARRRQRLRLRRHAGRDSGRLSQLSPLTLARLLHGIAAGAAAAEEPVMPGAAWRVACTLALRAALGHMDAECLALALPSARALGVRIPAPPARRALHRVARDAKAPDANHLAALLSSLSKDVRLARTDWVLLCMQRLTQYTRYLSGEAVVQVAATLPRLELRRPRLVDPSSTDTAVTAQTQKRAQIAGQWSGCLTDLAVALAQQAPCHVSGMTLCDTEAVMTGLNEVPDAQPETQLAALLAAQLTARAGAAVGVTRGRQQGSRSAAKQPAEVTHPAWLFLHRLEQRLQQFGAPKLLHVLQSAATHVAARHVPPAFGAAAEAATHTALSGVGLSGGERVQLLYSLARLGRLPSAPLLTLWYQATQSHLARMTPHNLSTALRVAEETSRAAGVAPPPAAWLAAAAQAADVAARAAAWALDKQLSRFAGESAAPTDAELQAMGATSGELVAIAARLHALGAPPLPDTTQQLIASHVQRVSAYASADTEHSVVLLHAAHELRGLHATACPDWVRAAGTAVLTGVLATDPSDLVFQMWQLAAVSTPLARTKHRHAGQAAPRGLPGAPVVAAHRVVELFVSVARWRVDTGVTWLRAVLRQVSARVSSFTGPQAAAFLRTLALMQLPQEALETPTIRQFLNGSLTHMLKQCSLSQLAEVGWAISMLQINPGQQWWDDYEASLLPRMRHMPVDGLCEVMWAMGALRHRPARAWMEGFAGSLVPQLSVCTPDQLARLIWALAAVEEVPTASFTLRYLTATQHALQVPGSFTAQSLTLLVGGLAALGVHPRTEWCEHYLAQLTHALPTCRAVHLSKVLQSLDTLSVTLDDVTLTALTTALCERAADMDLGAAAQASQGLSRLDTSQGQRYLRQFVDALARAHPPPAGATTAESAGRRVRARPGVSRTGGGRLRLAAGARQRVARRSQDMETSDADS